MVRTGASRRVVSISQDGKYGLYTSLEDHGAGSVSGVYWSLREDWNSILAVMNVGDEQDRVTVELAYNGGTFVLPEFALLPRQSRTLNLRKLLAEGLVDCDGNPFPEGVDHGGYLIYGSERPLEARLLVKEHRVSQRLEVAAPFYQTCNYAVLFFLSDASPVTLNIGQTHNIYPKCEMNNGSVYAESGSTQWSDYPSIASVSGTGTSRVITGLSPGLTWIDGETTEASDEFCTQTLFRQDQPKEVRVRIPWSAEVYNTIVQGSASCQPGSAGWSRTVTMQLHDQFGGAYNVGGITMADSIQIGSPNDLGITEAQTGSWSTDSNGRWPDTFFVCSTGCPGTGQTDALQYWTYNGNSLQHVNLVVYKCNSITVDGR